jgi:hypothetical protein
MANFADVTGKASLQLDARRSDLPNLRRLRMTCPPLSRTGLTAPLIPALYKARHKRNRGADHGHYRRNLAVSVGYGAG